MPQSGCLQTKDRKGVSPPQVSSSLHYAPMCSIPGRQQSNSAAYTRSHATCMWVTTGGNVVFWNVPRGTTLDQLLLSESIIFLDKSWPNLTGDDDSCMALANSAVLQ
jgi:hypothetical protein